ncbi:MAG: polyprenyl synthetase family protein [Chloroflexota bacterium]
MELDAERPLLDTDEQTDLGATFDQFADLLAQETERILNNLPPGGTLASTLQWFVRKDQAKKRQKWPYAYLPFLTCGLVGGAAETAVSLATTWNLLHLAAHLFDDIADEGFINGPQGPLPPGVGVNLATTLLFLGQTAFDTLSAASFPLAAAWALRQQLNQMLVQMCHGQHQDLVASVQPDSDQALYWQIATAKTGDFFGWASQAGAWIGGGDDAAVEASAQFGHNLGLLLQIMDDWHDLHAENGNSDLAQGKRTLPVLYALTVAPPARKQALQAMLSTIPLNVTRETAVRQAIIELGGLQYTLVQAAMRRQRAQAALAHFPDNAAKNQLLALLDHAFPFAKNMA